MLASHRTPSPDRPAFCNFCLAALAVILLTVIGFSTPATAELTSASVNQSINRGVAYLRKSQNERGGWDEFGGQSCGQSALCTLALINADGDAGDPTITSAIEYLRRFQPEETYSVALQTLVFCEYSSPSDLRRIRRNVQWMVDTQLANGSWSYGRARGGGDPSNAQFAILALGSAREHGVEVPAKTFETANEYWTSIQEDAGGWRYAMSRSATGSMTCAGIASLIITRTNLQRGAASIVDDTIRCCGSDEDTDGIERGLDWLGKNFSTAVNPGGEAMTRMYYLYALERVGRLSGRRFIGDHDWYREGAERLLSLQDDFRGYWRGGGPLEPPLVATSFAVLFLSKGRRKVVIGQLKYNDDPKVWRSHAGAISSLVSKVEVDWQQKLTWQTIDASRATVEDLLQAPVIVIAGNQRLNLSETEIATLGEYVQQGGTILFDATASDGCGTADAFNDDVAKLCKRWFETATIRRLPPDHPVWTAQRAVDIEALGDGQWVYGVEACCRTSVFYYPASLSCRWALADVIKMPQSASASAAQINAAMAIGENILAYATGRQLKDKLDSKVLFAGDSPPPIVRGTIRMAQLMTDADSAGADQAASTAARFMAENTAISITALQNPIGFDDEDLRDVAFLWVHGRTSFQWSESQRTTLQKFLETGGIMIGSAICGSEAFTTSFEVEIARLTGGEPLRDLQDDHPVMQMPGGYNLSSIEIRRPRINGGGEIQTKTGKPVLQFVADPDDELISVFYSPLDISCALESSNSVQCPGYSTVDAAKIVTNMILYGLSQ